MDKEILTLIGKMYIDIYRQGNYIEALNAKIAEFEAQLKLVDEVKSKSRS